MLDIVPSNQFKKDLKLAKKKILVIGCPGAGKSTFARKLREKLSFPIYYLDMIWHKPDRTTCSREEADHYLSL